MYEEADGWYENDMGWNRLYGIDCTKSVSAAIRWFKKSAAKGCPTAMVNLGNIYEDRKNYKNAYYWYEEAALLEDPKGMFNLANMYHWGWYVDQNYEKAYRYFKKLYELDSFDGAVCMYMGLYAENGYGREKSPEEAIAYYKRGILCGNGCCATNLGVMYSTGEDIPKDEKKGFAYYLRGAALGDSLAYADVGYGYETGQGVQKDLEKAKEYYEKGAGLGDEKAKENLQNLLANADISRPSGFGS